MIVADSADPQSDDPLVGEQYAVSVEACCSLAQVFLNRGYDVAIDDVLEPESFERHWRYLLRNVAFDVVIVLPALDETLRRSSERSKRVRPEITREQHAASLDWPAARRLDTTNLTIEESLAVAQKRGLVP